MIGVDVISLKAVSARRHHENPRYLNKVFLPHEQEWIHDQNNPLKALWALWAAKEAVYKASHLKKAEQGFYPKNLPLIPAYSVHENDTRLIIQFRKETFPVKLTSTSDYISATVCLGSDYISTVLKSVTNQSQDQSAEVRSLCLESLASIYDYNLSLLSIQSDKDRIPRLFIKEKKSPIALSLSHHGHYLAYAFVIPSKHYDRHQLD